MAEEINENVETQENESNQLPKRIGNFKPLYPQNGLKMIDIATIEQTIAKALGELTGEEYICDIDAIQFFSPGLKVADFKVSLVNSSAYTINS